MILIGPTELFITSNFDGHVQAWRWYCYSVGNYYQQGSKVIYGRKQK
jgi:hypothetical protein